ncbi:MAG: M2 family metallopeptidase, partial [Candidatus Cellulosilyticum pullistercoris]|nr:M2 family metallopeptidase [Candidatus Cellulosilyticum pullistercoris]
QLSYQLNTDRTDYFQEYIYSIELLGKMQTGYADLFNDDSFSKEMELGYQLSIQRKKLVDAYYNQEDDITVIVNGEEKHLIELLTSNALSTKEKIYYYDKWYTAYNQAVGEIFLELVKIDNQIAMLEGYDSYVAYMYDIYEREYALEESKAFIENVKQLVPKIYMKLSKKAERAQYNLQSYSYEDEESLLDSIKEHFMNQDETLGEAYDYLIRYKLYDISTRDNKLSGGLTVYLDSYQEPFILINYSRPYQTALTFIHEFGHYFSYFETGGHQGGLDLDETYSQAMELLAMPYSGAILGSETLGDEAQVYIMSSLLRAIIEGCLYEEFLQQVYENPNQTVQELNALYTKISGEYGMSVDGRNWCQVPHNYEVPFYYFSYGISAVAALEVWEQSLNQETGIQTYLNLIQVGRENHFLEALEKVGLSNPLEKETLERVIRCIADYLDINEIIYDKAA